MRYLCAALLALWAGPALAQMLAEGEDRRTVPFTVMDGKPMLPVTVAGQDGVMMFDLGTPSAVFLNRGAAALPPGPEVGRGFAASGQEIVVQLHEAPEVAVAGQVLPLSGQVRSGDFSFAHGVYGADFMGFLGLPAVADHGVLLDYGQSALTAIAVREGGMAVPPPEGADVIARLDLLLIPEELPMAVGRIGEVPILVTFDTGDVGAAYLTPGTRARLAAAGLLVEGATGFWEVSGLTLGGALMLPAPVALIEAGGEADMRRVGQPDELRLGAAFFATYPTLWDFPARRLMILRADAAILTAPAP